MNITLNVDESIVKKVRKIAIDRDTTLTAMVRDFLRSLAQGDSLAHDHVQKALDESFSKVSRDMGNHSWNRDSLHDR